MYKDIFKDIGLSPNEAIVYEYLIRHGESTAGAIIKETPIKRGVIYNALTNLKDKKLVSEKKTKTSKTLLFSPEHPNKLREFIDEKERLVIKAQNTLESNLSTFVSDFNLVSEQPGVKIYEGLDGIKKVLSDTLNSKTEILAIVDVEAVNKYMKNVNAAYVKQRNLKKIKKRLLVNDSSYARKHFANAGGNTNLKFFNLKISPFSTSIQIYDDKIAYISMSDKQLTSMTIQNPYIYSMHKAMFNFIWDQL